MMYKNTSLSSVVITKKKNISHDNLFRLNT